MLGHFRIRKSLTISGISHRQCQEVIPHNATDIQVVVQMFQTFIMEKFMFCVSHGRISYRLGRKPTRNLAIIQLSAQTDTLSIPHSKAFLKDLTQRLLIHESGVYIPNLKDWVLTPKLDKFAVHCNWKLFAHNRLTENRFYSIIYPRL